MAVLFRVIRRTLGEPVKVKIAQIPLGVRVGSELADSEEIFPFPFADLRASRATGNPTRTACPIISVNRIGKRGKVPLCPMAESGKTMYFMPKYAATP